MKEITAFLVYIGLCFGSLLAWIYSILKDAQADRIGWLVADVLIPPLGVIRGLILWL